MPSSSITRALGHLADWSDRDEWTARRTRVAAAHMTPVIPALGLPGDLMDLLPTNVLGVAGLFILQDFLTARFDDDGKPNLIDDFLAHRGRREPAPARRYLRALRDSTLSLYRVVDSDHSSVTLRDIVRGGDALTVLDGPASTDSRPACLAARVLLVDGEHHLAAGSLPLTDDLCRRLLAAVDELVIELAADNLPPRAQARVSRGKRTRTVNREAIIATPSFPRLLTQFWLAHALELLRRTPP